MHIITCRRIDMRVMHVDARPEITGSSSKMLSAYLIAQLKQKFAGLEVDYMDTSVQHRPTFPTILLKRCIHQIYNATWR